MSQWCNDCHRNIMIGRWRSCESDCPVFGLYFEDLAKKVVEDENNLKKFIATVYAKILNYDPNNTDLAHGYHRDKEIALKKLVETTKEFYGEQFALDTIYALVTEKLGETK